MNDRDMCIALYKSYIEDLEIMLNRLLEGMTEDEAYVHIPSMGIPSQSITGKKLIAYKSAQEISKNFKELLKEVDYNEDDAI